MKPVDRIPGGGQRLLTTGGHLLDLAHQRIGLVGIVSHIADGLAHLGDGRRQLLALGPLLLQVGVYGLDMPLSSSAACRICWLVSALRPTTARSSAFFMRSSSSRAARLS